MEEILERFINNFEVGKIKYLLADREFMSKEWLDFLTKKQIKFAIPLRKDMKIRIKNALQIKPVGKSFDYVKPFEYIEVKGVLWKFTSPKIHLMLRLKIPTPCNSRPGRHYPIKNCKSRERY